MVISCENMLTVKKIAYILFCWLKVVHGYNILAIYPQGFKSHFLFNTAIMNKLNQAGHEVAFITPFEENSEEEKFRINNSPEIDRQKRVVTAAKLKAVGTRHRGIATIETVYRWTSYENLLCYDIMELDEIKNALDGLIRFDVIFAEMMSMHGCYLLLAHRLNVPIIGTLPTSPWVTEYIIGNPIHPAYVPNAWSYTGNKMTLYDRMKNTIFVSFLYFWDTCLGAIREEAFRRKFFPETKWTDVKAPALLFLNSHPVLQPRPMVPNAIEIGGVHIAPVKPLPKRLRTFIDEAEHGVVLFTFGTNNSTHIHYTKEIFSSVFASIPQRVIWKLDLPYQNVPDNVLIADWVPQRDVLSHPNVKAFISHCGAFGMHEAVHTATPIVGIPLHIDQIHNALLLEELGVAVYLNILDLTKESLLDALTKVINDTRYKKNMQKLSNEFNDNPITASDKIVYWTEYVVKHQGTPHLKTMGLKIPFYQYFCLDVILCLVIAVFFAIGVIYYGRMILLVVKNRSASHPTKKSN